MNLERRIRRLNDILRTELGEPVYAWKWSEDLDHFMRKINPDTGEPQCDYVCACGRNKTIHDPSCASLVIPEPIYERRKLRFDLQGQWVLCKLLPNPPEQEWRRVFGTMLPYRPFEWAPCDPVYLDRGEEPTEAITWEVIRRMREHRSKTASDWNSEAIESAARREQRMREALLDDIKDSAPAFNGIPGRKEHYSFGGLADVSPQGE